MGSIVEQRWSHLSEQAGYAGDVADLLTQHASRAVLDKLVGVMVYTFPGGENRKFQAYTSTNQNCWDQKMAAVERLPVFDDGENESLEGVLR